MPTNHRVDVDLATYQALLEGRKCAHALDGHVGDNVAFVYTKPDGQEVAVWKGVTHADAVLSLGRPSLNDGKVRAVGVDPGLANTGICGVVYDIDTGAYSCGGIAFVKTKSQNAAKETHLRKTVFTVRRVERIWTDLQRLVGAFSPDIIGVEAYSVYEGKDYQNLRDAAHAVFKALGVDVKKGFPTAGVAAFRDFLIPHLARPDFYAALNKLRIATDQFRFVRGRGDAAQTLLAYGAVLCTGYAGGTPVMPFQPADLKREVAGRKSATKADVAAAVEELVPDLAGTLEAQKVAKGDREHVYDAAGHGILAVRKLLELRRTAGV